MLTCHLSKFCFVFYGNHANVSTTASSKEYRRPPLVPAQGDHWLDACQLLTHHVAFIILSNLSLQRSCIPKALYTYDTE